MGSVFGGLAQFQLIDPYLANQTQENYLPVPDQLAKDEKYLGLKVIRMFECGNRAPNVELLEGNIVCKRYTISKEAQRRFFWHEIGILERLKGCPYAAQLIHVNLTEGLIYMSFCGDGAPDTPENRLAVRKLLKRMAREYGVYRNKYTFRKFSGETINNVGQIGTQLYLYDFGGTHYHINPNWKQSAAALTQQSSTSAKTKSRHHLVKVHVLAKPPVPKARPQPLPQPLGSLARPQP